MGLFSAGTMRIHWLVDPEIANEITPRLIILGKFLPTNYDIDRTVLSHDTVQAERPSIGRGPGRDWDRVSCKDERTMREGGGEDYYS